MTGGFVEVLGNMLRAQGIDCAIVERQSREHVETRAHQDFFAENYIGI